MRSRKLSAYMWAVCVLLTAASVYAQDAAFTDPNVDYTFTLPDAKWKLVTRPSAISPNVEYVYGDRRDGALEVRKMTVTKDSMLSVVIRDEEQKLQFRPGYIAGKDETFNGRHKGTIFNFEYVYSGKAMGGRYYFLRAGDTTVYVLRFTGEKDSLRSIRNQTDQIARTFSVKPA